MTSTTTQKNIRPAKPSARLVALRYVELMVAHDAGGREMAWASRMTASMLWEIRKPPYGLLVKNLTQDQAEASLRAMPHVSRIFGFGSFEVLAAVGAGDSPRALPSEMAGRKTR